MNRQWAIWTSCHTRCCLLFVQVSMDRQLQLSSLNSIAGKILTSVLVGIQKIVSKIPLKFILLSSKIVN